jgi:hypothetical protein
VSPAAGNHVRAVSRAALLSVFVLDSALSFVSPYLQNTPENYFLRMNI